MIEPIELLECKTADELLEKLHPGRGQWPESGAWFFSRARQRQWFSDFERLLGNPAKVS